MDYSIAIQHAPWEGWRSDVTHRIESAFRDTDVPVARVNARRDKSVWHTAKRCWRAGYRQGRDYTIVLQDDIQLSTNFPQDLQSVIDALDDAGDEPPLCLFSPRSGHADTCRERDAPFIRVSQGIWGVARGLPTDRIPEFLSWQKAAVHPDHSHDDSREALYAEYQMEQRVFIPQPSLVEHLGACRSSDGSKAKPHELNAAWFAGDDDVRDWGYDDRENLPSASAANLARRYSDHLNPELIPDA